MNIKFNASMQIICYGFHRNGSCLCVERSKKVYLTVVSETLINQSFSEILKKIRIIASNKCYAYR